MKTLDLDESTQAERSQRLAGGMRELSIYELVGMVCALGYYLNSDATFNYVNTGNAIPYKARAVSIYHAGSGKSFANTGSPKDRLPELQEIRRTCFVFNAGRIWEL